MFRKSVGITSSISSVSRYTRNACHFSSSAQSNGKGVSTRHYPSPKRIFIVRHGEAWGNVDEAIFERVPDSQVPITPKGYTQALRAGRLLRDIIGNESVTVYCSPYLRAKQTADSIVDILNNSPSRQKKDVSNDDVSTHRQQPIVIHEDPRLREQDFGNLQRLEDIARCRREREYYGAFYYRFPQGEAGSDVFNRVSGFLESLNTSITHGADDDNIIIVTHGMTARLLLMRYFKWTVNHFHKLWNPNNCQIITLERNPVDTDAKGVLSSLLSQTGSGSAYSLLTPLRKDDETPPNPFQTLERLFTKPWLTSSETEGKQNTSSESETVDFKTLSHARKEEIIKDQGMKWDFTTSVVASHPYSSQHQAQSLEYKSLHTIPTTDVKTVYGNGVSGVQNSKHWGESSNNSFSSGVTDVNTSNKKQESTDNDVKQVFTPSSVLEVNQSGFLPTATYEDVDNNIDQAMGDNKHILATADNINNNVKSTTDNSTIEHNSFDVNNIDHVFPTKDSSSDANANTDPNSDANKTASSSEHKRVNADDLTCLHAFADVMKDLPSSLQILIQSSYNSSNVNNVIDNVMNNVSNIRNDDGSSKVMTHKPIDIDVLLNIEQEYKRSLDVVKNVNSNLISYETMIKNTNDNIRSIENNLDEQKTLLMNMQNSLRKEKERFVKIEREAFATAALIEYTIYQQKNKVKKDQKP